MYKHFWTQWRIKMEWKLKSVSSQVRKRLTCLYNSTMTPIKTAMSLKEKHMINCCRGLYTTLVHSLPFERWMLVMRTFSLSHARSEQKLQLSKKSQVTLMEKTKHTHSTTVGEYTCFCILTDTLGQHHCTSGNINTSTDLRYTVKRGEMNNIKDREVWCFSDM